MRISARVENAFGEHLVTLRTGETTQTLSVPSKPGGFGSGASGGEVLCLALATCYCNDLYREAKKQGIEVRRVEVEAEATFGVEGAPAEQISYRARVWAKAARQRILELMRHTDSVAEVQNTLRRACPVHLADAQAYEAA